MGKEDLFSEVFNRHDKNVNVDRKEENELINRFQETGDMAVLEEVYVKRLPTLKNWALRYYYPGLEISIDDFMEELSIVFVKAANKYNIKKGSFNTCLYTYLLNRIKNMKNSTHAKKRRPKDYDGPVSGILLSLDHVYSNDKSTGETTLKDILANEDIEEEKVFSETNFRETIGILSGGDEVLENVFIKLGQGSTLSSIIKDLKIVEGNVKLSNAEVNNLKLGDSNVLKNIIFNQSDIDYGEFTIVGWELSDNNKVTYSIELMDNETVKKIKNKIKYLRKNKEEYIEKIKSR